MNKSSDMMGNWIGPIGVVFMFIFWLLIIALVVTLIWFLIRKGSEQFGESKSESSIEILKKRFARGEIDEEEYHQKREKLNK